MLLQIPDVLTRDQVEHARQLLDAAEWIDGRVTAGHQSARAKDNVQLPEDHPTSRRLGDIILAALQRNSLFISAALPLRVFPPLFNRYQGGQSFGNHVDNAIRQVPGSTMRIRTDLSATLFLADPSEYDGGELMVEDTYGVHSVKLPAGHLVLYPSTSLHNVRPVTRGARIASICTGAYLLAAAGLLSGRHATTHWMNAADFAWRYPEVKVDPGVLYVDEGDVLTSAGTGASMISKTRLPAAAPRWIRSLICARLCTGA